MRQSRIRKGSKRTRFDIWASILDLLVAEDSALTHIVISARLKRRDAKGHLQAMAEEGLVRQKRDKFVEYSITEDGVRWLKNFQKLTRNRRPKESDTRTDFE